MITQDKIIEWAQKAGLTKQHRPFGELHALTAFANFAMQYQKEQDAQICEELRVHYGNGDPDGDECAAAIRNQE